MKFIWQDMRQEAIYYEEATKQIFAVLEWHQDQSRFKIHAEYVGPAGPGKSHVSPKDLGYWRDETKAKDFVASYVAALFPQKELAA